MICFFFKYECVFFFSSFSGKNNVTNDAIGVNSLRVMNGGFCMFTVYVWLTSWLRMVVDDFY